MGQERGLKQKEREEIPVYRVEYHLTGMCLSGNFIICKLGLYFFGDSGKFGSGKLKFSASNNTQLGKRQPVWETDKIVQRVDKGILLEVLKKTMRMSKNGM